MEQTLKRLLFFVLCFCVEMKISKQAADHRWRFKTHTTLQAVSFFSRSFSFLSELKSRAAWSNPSSSLIFSQPYKSPYLSITWDREKEASQWLLIVLYYCMNNEWQQLARFLCTFCTIMRQELRKGIFLDRLLCFLCDFVDVSNSDTLVL